MESSGNPRPMRARGGIWVGKRTLFVLSILALAAGVLFIVPNSVAAQDAGAERDALQKQLESLEQEAAALDSQIASTQSQAKTLEQQIKVFDAEIRRRQIEIQRLTLAIRQAGIDIQIKTAGVDELTLRIAKNRASLARNIQLLDGYDREHILVVLAKNETLSDFFTTLDNIRDLQGRVEQLVTDLRENKSELEQERQQLEDFREQQFSLKALAEIERRAVQEKKAEKDRLLKLTRGKEAVFQQLLSQKKRDITALKTQLFYIEKTGITAEDALKFAQLAASRTGIRTAFLLALLEVETGKQFEGGVITAGTHLGTGNWRDDMYTCYIRLGRPSAAEAQKNAFFAITSKLNLDPDKMPVSRRPSYGCGGAMGPAQFIPTTWLLFEKKTAALTGHNPPSPWNIEDAFTASAIFLSESGASLQTRAGELAAARTYISGKPSCPPRGSARYACIAYGNRVVSLAADIDRVI